VDWKLATNCAAVYPVNKEKNSIMHSTQICCHTHQSVSQDRTGAPFFTYLETIRNNYHTNAFIVTHKHRIWADYCTGCVW